MRNFRISALTGVLILVAAAIACGQSNNAEKVAALNQALKAGVITQDEYNVKMAQLKGNSVDPAKQAALDDAYRNGLLTQQEYNAKLRALNGASGSAPVQTVANRPAPAAGGSGIGRGTKTIVVVDSVMGGMPAYKVTIPADWSFDGAVLRSDCGGLPFLVYRAYSPDRLTGAQIMPNVDWYSAADLRAYQMAGVSPCNLHPPARPADVAAKIATDLRTGAQVIGLVPLPPDQAEKFRKATEETSARLAASPLPQAYHGTFNMEGQRVEVRYDFEGRPIEEMLTVSLTTRNNPVSVASAGPGGIIQPSVARLIHTEVGVSGIHAPAGRLEATLAALEPILKVEMVPEWNEAEIALINRNGAAAIAAIEKTGAIVRAQGDAFARQMQASNDQYHAWQQQRAENNRQQFAQDMQRKDANAANFLDYVKDQTYYVNPSTGQTMTISNIPGVAGYVGQNPSGGWTQLVPISH